MADESMVLRSARAGIWDGGTRSCSGHSTRKKIRSSGGSKTSSVKVSCTESPSSSWTVKNGPSSVENSFLNGVIYSSTDADKEIAAKAVALVVNHTRKGKTGIVSLCSLVGNILQAKLSLNQVVSSQKQEIGQLRSLLRHSSRPRICISSSSSGSNDPAFGLTTVGTQTKGDHKKLTVERSTYTSCLAEKPEQVDMPWTQTDTSGEETDSFESTCTSPLIEKPEQVDVSSQTDTSGEETDSSGCRIVFKDCQSICCQTDEGLSGYLNCPEHKRCRDVSQPQGVVGESIEQQLKTATEKILLLEKQISILKTELWVLRRKVSLPQLVTGQGSVPRPPSSNLCHPQQNEMKDIDVETSTLTPLLPTRRPMSPRQVSNQSSELRHLNLRMEMDQIITYNQINSAKHKERKSSILRSTKIHPALPHSPDIQSHTKKPCASDELLESRCPGCENTLPFSGDPRINEFRHNQNKKPRDRSRAKVLPSVGDRVVIEGQISGVVKYLGPIDKTRITYVGLHLDAPVGKGTGTLNGKTLFACPRNYCKFALVEEVLCIISQGKPPNPSSSSSFAVASRKRSSKLLQ